MSSKRYPEEFKIEAVKQITDRGHPHSRRLAVLGRSPRSLLAPGDWLVDALTHGTGTGDQCLIDGGVATTAEAGGDRAF